MNQELGKRYRKIVLAPGGSRDGMDVIKDFLQRDPTDEAFLR
jgi:Zn-dependent oligopeptidase